MRPAFLLLLLAGCADPPATPMPDAGADPDPADLRRVDGCDPFAPIVSPVIHGAPLGYLCASGNLSQSTCAADLICIPVGNVAMCTRLGCAVDADCGTGARCLQAPPYGFACLPSCTTNTQCPPGMTCSLNMEPDVPVCLPSCSTQPAAFCPWVLSPYATCGVDGVCRKVECANGACPAGMVCRRTNGVEHCAPDCRTAPDYCCVVDERNHCDQATGLCERPVVGPGPGMQ